MTEGQKIRAQLHMGYAIENVERSLQILEAMRGSEEPMSWGKLFTAMSFVQQAATHVGIMQEIAVNCEVAA